MPTDEDLTKSTELLNSELPDPRFADHENQYLRWLYEQNPCGPAYEDSVDEDGVRMAHYALVPQEYRDASGPQPGVFSLNAVTRTGTQRKGYFVTLGKQLYRRAAEDGRRLLIGVPNEKSVSAGPKYLGWRLIGQVPVRICPPTTLSTRQVEDIPVTPEFLASDHFASLTADIDDYPTTGATNCWNTERLRWRLARPHAHHVVHVTDEVLAVSMRTVQRGVPAAVLMKLLPRGGRCGPLRSRAIVASACRHHRAPVAVHGGWNEHVVLRGVQPPSRLRPAPLFLLVQSLQPDYDQDAIC